MLGSSLDDTEIGGSLVLSSGVDELLLGSIVDDEDEELELDGVFGLCGLFAL